MYIQERKVQLLIKNAQLFNKCFFTASSLRVVDVAKYLYTPESELPDQLKISTIKNCVPEKTHQMP